MRKYKLTRVDGPGGQRQVPNCKRNEQPSSTVTSSCNGCSEELLGPTAVPLVVANSEEDLDRLEVECIHNQQDPSWAVRCKGPVEAVQDKVEDERRCSVALDVLGEGGCGIVAANRPWSSGVAHQTSVQEDSSEGAQVQG